MILFFALWVATGLALLVVVIRGHGGLNNMMADGVGGRRRNDVLLFGSGTPREVLAAVRKIDAEIDLQKRVGAPRIALGTYLLLGVIVYGMLGPFALLGLFSIPLKR